MTELDTLLACAGAVDVRPLDLEDLRARVARRRRRRAWVGGAAFLALALAAGAIGVSARRAQPTRVVSDGGRAGDVSSLPSRWDRQVGIPNAVITRVITHGGATVAVGASSEGSGASDSTRPAIWLSVDRTWERVYVGQPVAYPKTGRVSDITFSHGRFVAVGQRISATSTDVVAGVWTSTDARSWHTVPEAPFDSPGSAIPATTSPARSSLNAVVTGPFGIFTLGQVFVGSFSGGVMVGGFTPAAWSSSDGDHWQRTNLVLPGARSVTSAARLGDQLVIVGGDADGAAAWTSRDATVWAVATVEGSRQATIEDIASARGRLIAVGTSAGASGAARPAIWTATDPAHFAEVKLPEGSDGTELQHVAGASGGFVAIGWKGPEPTPSMVVWSTQDGDTWTPLRRDGDVFEAHAQASAVGIAGGRIAIVGTTVAGIGTAADPIRASSAIWYGN